MDREIELEHQVIKQNHLLWKLKFNDTYQKQLNDLLINKLTDPRQCECGRLLYGSHFFSINADIAGIEELESEHENVHALAKDVITDRLISGRLDDLASSSKKFLELLDSVYTEIEKQYERKRLRKTG